MKKWNMIIDVALCHDCNNCFLADKDEYVGQRLLRHTPRPSPGPATLDEHRAQGAGPVPHRAGGLSAAALPCTATTRPASPPTAPSTSAKTAWSSSIRRRPKAARRSSTLAPTAPSTGTRKRDVAQKCTGCAHLIDEGWTETRCYPGLPHRCPQAGPGRRRGDGGAGQAEGLEAYRPSWPPPAGLLQEPPSLDQGLRRRQVAYRDTDECAEGAKVPVVGRGEVGEAITNNYGDFIIDKLEPGTYEVSVNAGGYTPVSRTVEVKDSVNLGVVFWRGRSRHASRGGGRDPGRSEEKARSPGPFLRPSDQPVILTSRSGGRSPAPPRCCLLRP